MDEGINAVPIKYKVSRAVFRAVFYCFTAYGMLMYAYCVQVEAHLRLSEAILHIDYTDTRPCAELTTENILELIVMILVTYQRYVDALSSMFYLRREHSVEYRSAGYSQDVMLYYDKRIGYRINQQMLQFKMRPNFFMYVFVLRQKPKCDLQQTW